MCATMFSACSKDDDTDPFDAGGEEIITMQTEKQDFYFTIGTAKADEIITVDWGDGQTQEFRSVKEEEDEKVTFEVNAKHVYAQSGAHSIKVTGAVTKFRCTQYQLTALDISKCTTITELTCLDSEITSLDVSKNIALTVLDCRYSQLTELDVSKCKALRELLCNGSQLTELNISGCTALKELVCGENELTSLDVSKSTTLTYLKCYNNKLTTLDVSKCTALRELSCGGNELTSLDVSKCTALTDLRCDDNLLTSKALNKIFTDLPQGKTWVDEYGYKHDCWIYISNNPGSDTCNKSIAENKGWGVVNR